MVDSIKLRNEVKLPSVGLGTWQINDKDLMSEVISCAYDSGYTLFDTAASYSNEIALSKAIARAGIPREKILLSDKVWNTCRGYEQTIEACKKSMKKLKTDYLDLYLVHWPASVKLYTDWAQINADTWRGMERLYKDGLVRAIGVCNFKTHHLEKLKETAEIMPFINQIEYHPGFTQYELVTYCRENYIQIEASSPLGNGRILENDQIKEIALSIGKSAAQICLRWGVQNGSIVIPKSSDKDRIMQNIDIFDFELTEGQMKILSELPFCGGLNLDSDKITEFG